MKQFAVSQEITRAQASVLQATREGKQLLEQLQELVAKLNQPKKLAGQEALAARVEILGRNVMALLGVTLSASSDISEYDEAAADPPSIRSVGVAWELVERAAQSADAAPTPDAIAAVAHDELLTEKVLREWDLVKGQDLAALNRSLQQANFPPVSLRVE